MNDYSILNEVNGYMRRIKAPARFTMQILFAKAAKRRKNERAERMRKVMAATLWPREVL